MSSRGIAPRAGIRNRPNARAGVEMSMNMIIVIVVGLIILAIIIYLLVKNTGGWQGSITSCREKGGTCKSTCDSGESGSSFFKNGCDGDTLCCIPEKSLVGG